VRLTKPPAWLLPPARSVYVITLAINLPQCPNKVYT
jgi:hypothetical protein